jgi:hypothetical protein
MLKCLEALAKADEKIRRRRVAGGAGGISSGG